MYGEEARRFISGKSVLVTGAGGSIGSEIARQSLALGASKVWLLDNDGGALWGVSMSIFGNALFNDEAIILADICDTRSLEQIFASTMPDIVFHAAAHKYLTLLERFPAEAVKTNVFGTQSVFDAARSTGVNTVVNISTDKAANPTSVLGWSKRTAEYVTPEANGYGMTTCSVRFGNVLGSRGSLLQIIHEQIHADVPVTITDSKATRYFMSIPEAASLVIEAARMAEGGETFVLDMGKPVKILDLLDRYVSLVGCSYPEIKYIGLRQGEKLHEILSQESEGSEPTEHERISRHRIDSVSIRPLIYRLHKIVEQGGCLEDYTGVVNFHEKRSAA